MKIHFTLKKNKKGDGKDPSPISPRENTHAHPKTKNTKYDVFKISIVMYTHV
jgi:hypothetical protein